MANTNNRNSGEAGESRVPGDLHLLTEWLPITRRLRSLASQQMGPAVIRLTVIVDDRADPQVYTVKAVKIEPKARIASILDWLTGN